MLTTMTTGATTDSTRAQSEIIGAILLIVISIILASFVAIYVFDIGGQQLQDPAPQVSFTFRSQGTDLVATHSGGETVDASTLDIVVIDDGSSPGAHAVGETDADLGDTTRISADDSDAFDSGDIEAGESATVAEGVGDDDIVRIVYINPDSEQGAILAEYVG